jgi:predicted LPLAT superfamily acyltransferase
MTSQKEGRENVNLSTPIFDNRPQADLIRDKIKDKNEAKASYLEKHPPDPPRRSLRNVDRKPFTGGRRSKRRRKSKRKSNKRFRRTRSKRQRGGTPDDDIFGASMWGHTQTVAMLLENGADVNAKNNDGKTVLMLASWYGHTETVAMLLEKGADVNAKMKGETALHMASFLGHTETVAILLDAGADANEKLPFGTTALIWASERGHPETVRILLERGADVNAKTDYDYTALMAASKYGHTEIEKLLKQYIVAQIIPKHLEIQRNRKKDRQNLHMVMRKKGVHPTLERFTGYYLGGKRKTKKSRRKSKRKTRRK